MATTGAWNTIDPATCLSYAVGTEFSSSATLTTWSPGELWAFGHPFWNGFVTVLPPNGPSCYSADDNPSNDSGLFTAGSRHPGGALTLKVDGSVDFNAETIDSSGGASGYGVWGALGTRAGGEAGE